MHKKLLHKYLLISLLFLFVQQLHAQRCEWLNVYGNWATSANFNDVVADNNNNFIACGIYYDSIELDNIILPKNQRYSPLIVKFNTDGEIIWALDSFKAVPHLSTTYFNLEKVLVDNEDDIYVLGFFNRGLDFGNGIKIIKTPHVGEQNFILKLDSSGKPQWARTFDDKLQVRDFVVDGGKNLYLMSEVIDTASVSGTSDTIIPKGSTDIAIIKYSPKGDYLDVWHIGDNHIDRPYNIAIDGLNNIYMTAKISGSFFLKGKSYSASGNSILKIDSSGCILHIRNLNLTSLDGLSLLIDANEQGNCIVAGFSYLDTIDFGNNVFLIKDSLTKAKQGLKNLAIVYFDSTLKTKWAQQCRVIDDEYSIGVTDIEFSYDNIYFGGAFHNGKVGLGPDIILDLKHKHSANANLYIAKVDTLGNFLWGFANASDQSKLIVTRGFAINKRGSPAIVGYFTNDSIRIFDKSLVNKYGSRNTFIAKLQDYSIYRGFVKSGPYCAGDTINIPYTKKGDYNVGNEFIAQLSDSAGNFESGFRELGRLKDTSSGVIKGTIPLFNVATTNKYRIRILSTNPVVQSYYKIDTLRLLIYSKDTANAGRDTLLCKGQNVKLATTGGSKWSWTPTSTILNKDSTNRHIWVQPDSTTEYRIIISDSSGCGVTDTDYVKVYVRPKLDANVQGDSISCRGTEQKLKVIVNGGDSTQYWYKWFFTGFPIILSEDSVLSIKAHITNSYMVIVGDSCTSKMDTAYFTVKVVTNLKANPSPDTTICKGKSAQLSVIGTGCNPNKYTYEWIEKGNSTILSTNDSLLVSPLTTTQYQVILKDTSTLLIDTATITVTVDSIFNISTLPDSTICLGQTIDLTANVFSCDTSNMIYTWDNGLGTGKTKTISPNTTTTYTIIGENTFNGLKDTAQVTITVRPKLTLTLNADSTICVGEQAELRATATGGRSSTHNILWSEVGSQWTSPNPTVQISPNQTTTYKAILSDGCTVNNDSATITITVRPKLEITVNPDTTICIGEQAELRAIANGGLESKHIIQWENKGQHFSNNPTLQVGPTQTVTYTAILSDGCTVNNDSAEITITVRPKLTLTLNSDSTICTGEQAQLRATTNGGLENNHNILWTAVGSQWTSNNPITQVTPSATTTYRALLSDGCTDQNDSAEITITVRPPLQLTTVAKDSICSNEILLLTATLTGGYSPNHQILWTVGGGLWTSNQNPATDTPQINTKYIAALSDNCSPTVYDTLEVIVLPIPKADFTATPLSGCPPLKVTLTDNSTDNDSTQNTWTIGLAEYQSTKTQTHEILKQGVYNIKLNVKNALGCSDEKTQIRAITVFTKPKADFLIKPDIKEVEEALQLYNLSQNYTSVIWDMGDGNTLSPQYGKDTSYKYHEDDTGQREVQLIAINNQGCKDTSKQNILLYNKVHCTIPTAFTPNGDDLNNIFKPVCVGVGNYTLTIYNRWGQVIYQRENGAWDGNYADNPSPSGVYMYKLQINAQSKKKKLTYGTVQVIR
jgi:gliding motility-associated-like protein